MDFQHYIPQFILRNFSHNKKNIWTYSAPKGLEERTIKTVFGQRHLYSEKAVDFRNRASRSIDPKTFEQSIRKDPEPYDRNVIGRMETTAAPIVEHLIERTRLGRQPIRNFEQVSLLQQFLYLTARRTPESQINVLGDSYRDADEWAFRRIKSRVDDKQYSFDSIDEMYRLNPTTRRIREIARENHSAEFAAGISPAMQADIRRFCEDTGLLILSCRRAQRQFIIGSYGYAIVVRTSTTSDYSKAAVFPLSPDVAIVITDHPKKYGVGDIFPILVHQTNIAMAEHSHTIAGASKGILLNYSRYVKST